MRALPPIADLRARTERIRGRKDAVEGSLERTRRAIRGLEDEEELLSAVCALFRTLIDMEVADGVKAVEQLLTEGLQAVFNDLNLSVSSNVKEARGKIAVELITEEKNKKGDIITGSAKDDFGGSVLTVQSVLLRVIIMLRRGLRPFLLLDETLPAFDSNYVTNMGNFLSVLCSRLGIDILMVTHNPALFDSADRAYRIVRKGGAAHFVKVR